VRTPAGSVMIDATGRANGRGAYVCRDGACIDRAMAKGGLGRALEAPIPGTLGADLRIAAGFGDEAGTQGTQED
jgi:uncharacterized protein